MQPVPDNSLSQLNALLEQKAVPPSLRDDYWKCYYHNSRYLSRLVRQISAASRGQQHRPVGNPSGYKRKALSNSCFLP